MISAFFSLNKSDTLLFEEKKEERSASLTVTDLDEPTFSFKNEIDGDVEQLKAYK